MAEKIKSLARARVLEILRAVGLEQPEDALKRAFPHKEQEVRGKTYRKARFNGGDLELLARSVEFWCPDCRSVEEMRDLMGLEKSQASLPLETPSQRTSRLLWTERRRAAIAQEQEREREAKSRLRTAKQRLIKLVLDLRADARAQEEEAKDALRAAHKAHDEAVKRLRKARKATQPELLPAPARVVSREDMARLLHLEYERQQLERKSGPRAVPKRAEPSLLQTVMSAGTPRRKAG